MRKTAYILLIILFAQCVALSVYADTPAVNYAYTVNGEAKILRFSGTVTGDSRPESIILRLTDASGALTPETAADVLFHMFDIPLNADGTFSKELNMSGVAGARSVAFVFGNLGAAALSGRSGTIYYPSAAECAAALAAVNGASTEAQMNAALASYLLSAQPVLGVYDTALYAANAALVASELVAKRPFASVAAFQAEWSAVVAVLDKNAAILAAINGANRESLTTVLEQANDVLKLDLSGGYKTLGTIRINQKLIGAAPYPTLDAFVKAFNDAVKEAATPTPTPKGGSGGGGTSSGTSVGSFPASVKVTTPVATPTPPPQTVSFVDLDSVPWAKDAIEALAAKGVVNGTGDGRFSPERAVTREEFLKMLMLALDLSPSEEGEAFSDVVSGAWYAPFVRGARQLGIAEGRPDGSFGIGQTIRREDMAVMAVRAAAAAHVTFPAGSRIDFADADDISDYAKQAVDTMSMAAILNGYEDGRFAPDDFATRAQAAKIIYGITQNQ
ncbi:hypothetical protein FACS189492_2370 [Clostridia bacterium]|nr:hypothetical protein FACS189492_2370 [Clostridia bacterium]